MKAYQIRTLGIAFLMSLTLLLSDGCSSGTAPTQSTGVNPVQNGSFTWYVDAANGSTFGDGTTPKTAFRTLSQAAAVTLPGDTVQVADGTYTNNAGTTLDITLGGKANAWITWTAAPGAHPVITGSNTYDIVQVEASANYVILEGFTVMGDNSSIALSDALASDKNPENYPKYNGNCINVVGYADQGKTIGGHVKVLNNTVYNCSAAGIGGNADYYTISGNTIYNSGWYTAYGTSAIDTGVTYDSNPSDTTTPYKLIITNNILYANQEFVPWVAQGKITDGEAIIVDSNANSTYDSTVKYPAYTGRTLIANNVIYNTGSTAIEIYESAHVDIVNNSTYNDDLSPAEPGRGEITIGDINNGRDAYDVNVINNIMYNTLTNGNQATLILSSPCSTCTIDYNLYYGAAPQVAAGATAGAHSIYVDPMYVDPANSTLANVNLKLKSGSPAVGAGTTHLAPPTDINGNARPVTAGAGVTMGAYSQ